MTARDDAMEEMRLLPCPFCGGVCDGPSNYGTLAFDGHGNRIRKGRFVECRTTDCHASIWRYRPDDAEADAALVMAWNRRAAKALAAVRKDSLHTDPTPPSDESPVGAHLSKRLENVALTIMATEQYPAERLPDAQTVREAAAALNTPKRVEALDALDALVIHADAYLAGECSKAEFSEATERARASLSISSEGGGDDGESRWCSKWRVE